MHTDLVAESFSSVYLTRRLDSPFPHQSFSGYLTSVNITYELVVKHISSLDAQSSMGPDGLHPQLLKSCPSLTYPLLVIFQESLRLGMLPKQWKESQVIPIFKKGSRYSPLNYRPISLTSVCCKTLERVIVDCLYEYCESNSLFNKCQFGFRRGHTVEDQLLLTYNQVAEWYDIGFTVDVVLFDFSKAFDVVSHELLLEKLRLLGIGGRLLSWIGDFLTARTMRVAVSGSCSCEVSVESGVPQGSVLGPLLFVLYVNYLPNYVLSKCKFFADDLKIYLPIRLCDTSNTSQDITLCQNDINSIVEVSDSWGLTLNAAKCSVLRFQRGRSVESGDLEGYYCINDTPVPFVESCRDLGVLVDNQLKFHSHIQSIVSRAAGLSVNLLSSTLCRAKEFMLPLFLSHIRPLLEFSSCVWNTGFVGDVRLLEGVQRRWTKKIDSFEDLPYSQRLSLLNLYSVKTKG